MSVAIVLTGGTISMVPSSSGLIPSVGLVESALEGERMIGEDGVHLIPLEPYIDSSHVSWAWVNRVLRVVMSQLDARMGVLVSMGTDTLAYTAAAVAMALNDCSFPVVFTGASCPISEPHSDGVENLRQSFSVACSDDPSWRGVWVIFGGQAFPAVRASKQFRASVYNDEPADSLFCAPHLRDWESIVLTDPDREDSVLKRWKPILPDHWSVSGSGFQVFSETFVPVVLTLCPGVSDLNLERLLDSAALDLLIVRAYGSNNGPPSTSPLIGSLRKLRQERGVPVVVMSQSPFKDAGLPNYAASGGLLTDVGGILASDMTLEAVVGKWASLHARFEGDVSRIEGVFLENLKGECTPVSDESH